MLPAITIGSLLLLWALPSLSSGSHMTAELSSMVVPSPSLMLLMRFTSLP